MDSSRLNDFLTTRTFTGGEGLDILSAIGQGRMNTINGNIVAGASGAITPMGYDDPFVFGLAFGLEKALTRTGITESGIAKIEAHIATMDYDMANTVMIHRLKRIKSGHIKATVQDMNFYNHELIEQSLMSKGMIYDEAHQATLKIQGIKYEFGFDKYLYTEDALKASTGFEMWSNGIKGY